MNDWVFALEESVVSQDMARALMLRALDLWPKYSVHRQGLSSMGEPSSYYVFDGYQTAEHFPELVSLEPKIIEIIGLATGIKAVRSPFPRSAINVKVYQGLNSGQGLHLDTNPVTGLLYLSSSGAPTVLEGLGPDGTNHEVFPKAGKMMILRGKRVRHRVEQSDQTSVRAVYNFYTVDDMSRPDWIDRTVYENAPAPSVLH